MYTERMSEAIAIAGQGNPTTLNNTSINTGNGVDMSLFRRVMFVFTIGANSGSVVCKLQGATTSGGSFGDISGAAATAVTSANKTVTIEYRADQAGETNRFVKGVATEGNSANAIVSIVALAMDAAHEPANGNDAAAVTQRLVVA